MVQRVLQVVAATDKQLAAEFEPRQSRRGSGGQPYTLYDVARQLGRRVPFPKLVNLEKDIRTYFATILVDAVATAGGTLVVPEGLKVKTVPQQEW